MLPELSARADADGVEGGEPGEARMRLQIDNADGLGPVEYTTSVVTTGPVTITRRQGERTLVTALLDLTGAKLPVPAARARVRVTSDTGSMMFSGYLLSAEAASESAGVTAAACTRVTAVEDAWLTQAAVPVGLQPSGSATHAVSLAEVPLTLKAVAGGALHGLASDVTLSGEHEPTTYLTELFRGDGTTATFSLTSAPFRSPGSSTVLRDDFAAPVPDERLWTVMDPGHCLRVTGAGLTISGGNGLDGQTVLQFAKPVEMGGSIVAQASGVLPQPGSEGVLLGFYSGAVVRGSCVAGLHVKGAAGAQSVTALVNGAEAGMAYTFAAGHSYTFRVRLFCAEWQRVIGSYEALVNGSVQSFGGGLVSAPMRLVFEAVDEGLASNTIATVLYDGAIADSPAECTFAAVNAAQMQCSLASVLVQQTGPVRVVSTRSDGSTYTRREGPAGEGADFSLSTKGNVTFYPGVVPQPGELVTVSYRRSARAVTRVQDPAGVAQEQQVGLPGLPTWSGHVLHPAARSSADCAAAAQALLAFAGDASALVQGHCDLLNAQQIADIAPGDVLAVNDGTLIRRWPVWEVAITDGNCAPEVVRYRVSFAQTEARCLSFKAGGALAVDVSLPVLPVPAAGTLLGNLAGLQVVSATTSALQVDAGTDPPSGGGFEVRSADGGFAAAAGSSLVLRSPVRGFSVPRGAFRERFFVRMYDGSASPRYSQWSSAVLTHLPVA